MKNKILIIISTIFFSIFASSNDYKIIRNFPSESDMNKNDFFLRSPIRMSFSLDKVYVLDNSEQSAYEFDLNGKYIKTIGEPGHIGAPGHLKYAHFIATDKEYIYIGDQTTYIHVFDKQGQFLKKRSIIDFVMNMVPTRNGFFSVHTLGKNNNIFGLINNELSKTKSISSEFNIGTKKKHNWAYYISIKKYKDKIYCLQQYGTEFKIYNENGELLKKGKNEFSPFLDDEYKQSGNMGTYPAFAVYKGNFLAYVCGNKKFRFHYFTPAGKMIKTIDIPIEYENSKSNDFLLALDVEIVKEGNENYLYVLVAHPIATVYKIKVDDKLFES